MTGTDLALRSSAPIATSLPTPDEWRGIVSIATTLANTRIVPKAYWNKRDDIIAAALLGRNIGLDPMQSLLYVHVIEGKPSLSAECMVALVRKAGHTIRAITLDDTQAHVEGIRKDDGQRADFAFTMAHAQAAGLASKDNWKAYFRSMAWARAVSQLCRMLFPDVISGMSYVPEELGADVDGDGTPVGSTVKAADVPAALQPPQEDEPAEEVVDIAVMVEEPQEATQHHQQADEAETVEEVQPNPEPVTAQQVAAVIPGVTVGAPPVEDVDPYAVTAAETAPDAPAEGDPYATPPPAPRTEEEQHQDRGSELFPKGWPAKGRSGDMKGRDPWEVGDDDLRWLASQETRDPKYADSDVAKRAWCSAELRRRNLAANPKPQAPGKARNAETGADLDAAFQQAVALEPDPDMPLEMLNDGDAMTPTARQQMAEEMAEHGYATSVEHGLERITKLEAQGGFTAARARANVAHFRANPVVAS